MSKLVCIYQYININTSSPRKYTHTHREWTKGCEFSPAMLSVFVTCSDTSGWCMYMYKLFCVLYVDVVSCDCIYYCCFVRLYLFRPLNAWRPVQVFMCEFLGVYTYICTISHDGSYAAGWLLHVDNSSRKLGQSCCQLAVYNGRGCAAKLYDSSWPSSRRLIRPLPLPSLLSFCSLSRFLTQAAVLTKARRRADADADVHLTYADLCWLMLTYADVCWRMLSAVLHTAQQTPAHLLTYADVCWRMLTYSHVGWRRLTYADVGWRRLT